MDEKASKDLELLVVEIVRRFRGIDAPTIRAVVGKERPGREWKKSDINPVLYRLKKQGKLNMAQVAERGPPGSLFIFQSKNKRNDMYAT